MCEYCCLYEVSEARVIADFRRGENEICAFTGFYAAKFIVFFLQKFREKLSFPSERVKQFKKYWIPYP
jgi:hypothetical protein